MSSVSAIPSAIKFPRALVAETVDATLIDASTQGFLAELLFDLSEVEFADPLGLVYLIACARTLQQRGHSLRLELPDDPRVRGIMRRYRFGASLATVLGLDPADTLSEASRQYIGEPARHYLAADARGDTETRIVRQGASRVQEIKVLEHPTVERAAEASGVYGADERDGGVRTFLAEHLGRRWALVEPVMYEALANTAIHPNASRVVSVGRVDPEARRQRSLWLSVWDDGDSIIDTLHRAAQVRPLRVGDFAKHASSYSVRTAARPGEEKRDVRIMDSGDEIPSDAAPDTLLVAAAFPGVTSDPDRLARTGQAAESDEKRPGMGLYILISLAVEQLGGTVLLRAGPLAANFARPDSTAEDVTVRFQVGIVSNPEMGRYFSGNQVVIKLPIDRQT